MAVDDAEQEGKDLTEELPLRLPLGPGYPVLPTVNDLVSTLLVTAPEMPLASTPVYVRAGGTNFRLDNVEVGQTDGGVWWVVLNTTPMVPPSGMRAGTPSGYSVGDADRDSAAH